MSSASSSARWRCSSPASAPSSPHPSCRWSRLLAGAWSSWPRSAGSRRFRSACRSDALESPDAGEDAPADVAQSEHQMRGRSDMGCLFVFFGSVFPRLTLCMVWIARPARVDAAFDTWIWPLLGVVFLPLTTLLYVVMYQVGGLRGWDWFWLALA